MASYDSETDLVEDEYDDLDDFIVGTEDGDDVGDEDEEDDLPEAEEEEEEVKQEEEEEPPVGVQEILSIREQLKAKYRKQHQSNGIGAGMPGSSPSVQEPARSRFGTFFGPSTPALAPRLIEAGSSSIMMEIQNVPSRRDAAPSASKSQPNNVTPHEQKPKFVPQVKRKVDTLRENRDYSSLFSDDADAPPPAKESPENKPVVSPKSDVEVRGKPMQSAGKNNKVNTGQPARAPKDHGSVQGRVQSNAGSLVKKPVPLPNGRKTNPSVSNGSRPSNDIKRVPGLQPSSNGQNLQRSMQSKRPQASPAVQKQQQRLQTQRPPQVQRQQNNALPSSQVLRVNSSVQSQQQPAPKGSTLSQDRRKLLGQKQLAPSSKPKTTPASAVYSDRPKKTVGVKRKLSEAERVRQMVRDVFNYNPDKYAGRDEDDRNMEAGYASIQMEERRSAKLARKEDDEQLQMIQEEERRERANKKKKQRAQS